MTEQDCGCQIYQGTLVPWTGPSIIYCPMHKAAPEMLAALEGVYIQGSADSWMAVRAAIAQAQAQEAKA